MVRLAKRVKAGYAAQLGCYHASALALLIGVGIYAIPFLLHRLKEEQNRLQWLASKIDMKGILRSVASVCKLRMWGPQSSGSCVLNRSRIHAAIPNLS